MTDFQTFMSRRDAAATAYCEGDASGVNSLVAKHYLVSFFGPDGKSLQGAQSIKAAFAKGASAFGPGGKVGSKSFRATLTALSLTGAVFSTPKSRPAAKACQ